MIAPSFRIHTIGQLECFLGIMVSRNEDVLREIKCKEDGLPFNEHHNQLPKMQKHPLLLNQKLTSLSQSHALKSEQFEPLNERKVLQHMADGFTHRKIANRLYLSLNAVRIRTRNIYGKLGVNNRTQAVAEARSLALLSPA